MPVRTVTELSDPAVMTLDTLRAGIIAEFTTPTDDGPDVVFYPEPGGALRIVVVWDQWEGLDLPTRSGVILEACEHWGDARPAPLSQTRVSAAVGYTREEAEKAAEMTQIRAKAVTDKAEARAAAKRDAPSK